VNPLLPPTILALHGFTGGGGDFAPLAEVLPEFAWHTPDLPGHAPDLAAPGAPADDGGLEASFRYLDSGILQKSDGPKILLGYSLGGRLALRYALARPGRWAALVLIGVSPGLEDAAERGRRRAADEWLAQKIIADGVAAFLAEWQARPLIATQARLPEAWRAAMRGRRRHLRAEGLAASLRQFGQGALEPAWDRLAELRLPVLVCAGAEDEKYAALAQKMLASITGAELLLVPQAGHLAHLENRDAFAGGLRAFLQKHGWGAEKTK
jgi:2-succinyl-6-hydroxy-2,4-cyclohexadiene-1-carboxylate synthase